MTNNSLSYSLYNDDKFSLLKIGSSFNFLQKGLKQHQISFQGDMKCIKNSFEAVNVGNIPIIERPDFPEEKNENEERRKRRIEKEQIREEIAKREEKDKEEGGGSYQIRRQNYLKLQHMDPERNSTQVIGKEQ